MAVSAVVLPALLAPDREIVLVARSCKNGVLENVWNFTRKHMCRSLYLIFNNVVGNIQKLQFFYLLQQYKKIKQQICFHVFLTNE